jgi:predicted O-methyltransferase YrrM
VTLARLGRKADKGAGPARTTGRVDRSFDRAEEGIDYYGGVLIGVETIAERALDPAVLDELLSELGGLKEDDYLRYVRAFVTEGRRTAGSRWRYADIVTALAAASELVQPRSYLEIGVRRGRSMSVVARRAPGSAIIGVDRWDEGYAGMENPGPEIVRSELERAGFRGSLELLSGDSHDVLPSLFAERPKLDFDLITVDGDHSPEGAAADLRDVIPRLRVGGVLVFDDIGHPTHPELNAVWHDEVATDRAFRTWEFDDIGYGVAVAVRRW